MLIPRFVQIHYLHSYPAALLNRDESGLAKRITFGGTPRTRISSQALKRRLRTANDKHSIHNVAGSTAAIRSRNIIGRKVIDPIRFQHAVADEVLDAVEAEFTKGLYGPNAKPGETSEAKRSRQPILFGLPEAEHLHSLAEGICLRNPDDPKAAGEEAKDLFNARRDEGRNFRAMLNHVRLPEGAETALFGRMVTSDTGSNIEGAVHIAHSFTVHREESESDYFSVVDDLQRDEDDPGAAYLGSTELTSGLYYGYAVIDVPGLVSNLEAAKPEEWLDTDRELAANMTEALIHLIATVSPGAKLGSTAPYARARFVMVEIGDHQPYTLAEAFRNPVQPQTKAALKALQEELERQDQAYGDQGVRRFMSVEDAVIPRGQAMDANQLPKWAAEAIMKGEVAG